MASDQSNHEAPAGPNGSGPTSVSSAVPPATPDLGGAKVYRRPRLVLLGKAMKLVRNDASGHLRDSSPNGWWVRNS